MSTVARAGRGCSVGGDCGRTRLANVEAHIHPDWACAEVRGAALLVMRMSRRRRASGWPTAEARARPPRGVCTQQPRVCTAAHEKPTRRLRVHVRRHDAPLHGVHRRGLHGCGQAAGRVASALRAAQDAPSQIRDNSIMIPRPQRVKRARRWIPRGKAVWHPETTGHTPSAAVGARVHSIRFCHCSHTTARWRDRPSSS